MVTQWYDPEGSSAALPGVISRALAARGHEVHVLTGFPNYPSGRLADGYRVRPYLREERGGVTVHRAPLYPSHDARAARRAANYLSFALGASAVATTKLPRLDVVLVHGTPATAAVPALALRRRTGTPFVYHVQDLWPDTVLHSALMSPRLRRIEGALHAFCDQIYQAASHVAVISPGMVDRITSRGVPHAKVHLVPNWADEGSFRPVEPDRRLGAQLGVTRSFTVMYAGIFGPYQGLDVVVEAADRLRARRDIGFALVGGGQQEASLRRAVTQAGLDNVTFVPMQPFAKMADVMALGDVQLISLRDLPLFRHTTPSKVQATLASGRPVLGSVAGDAAEVIRLSGAGPVVTPGKVDGLVSAIAALASTPASERAAMGSRGRAFYLSNYAEQIVSARLLDLLTDAASSRGDGR